MAFTYTTGLHKIRLMKKRIKCIPGGSGAGKTYAILAILIDMAIKNDGLAISVVSESTPHLRRGAMRDFIKIMREIRRYSDSKWNRTNLIYEFSNGSYIEFFGVDDDTKLRGARRNVLYLNEANKISEEAYTQLSMRTDRDIFIDWNPSNRFWANDLQEAEFLTLTYKDNQALPGTVVQFLESKRELAKTNDYWKNWCKVYLDGQLGALEGVVYSNWKIIDNIPQEASLIAHGLDFGYTNDPTACIAIYKYNDDIVLDEVIYRKGLSNNDISALLKDNQVKGEIYADSAEPKTIDELNKYGHKVYPTKKGPDSILAGIQLLQGKNMLVTKRSVNLVKELEGYTWKKDKDGNSLNVPIDAQNHLMDALRYVALMKLGKKRTDINYNLYNEDKISNMLY